MPKPKTDDCSPTAQVPWRAKAGRSEFVSVSEESEARGMEREKEEPQISRLKLRAPVPLTCFRQGPQDFRPLKSLSFSQRSSRRAAHLTPGAELRCRRGPRRLI